MAEMPSPALPQTDQNLLNDIEAVKQIPIVSNMLEVVCQLTGMGFAAVARVTEDKWITCSALDYLGFGLKPGDELPILSTLCNEIRDHRQPIVFDDVAKDEQYCNHHTPKTYGLQSYISYPIILKDGSFFGTLCAIDPKPNKVKNPQVMNTFALFAELLAFHLESLGLLERSELATRELQQKNHLLTSKNTDLDNFVYTASHDLKSPIANIESLLEVLAEAVERDELERDEINQIMDLLRKNLKRFSITIKDLTTFVEADNFGLTDHPEEINIFEVVENVKQELNEGIVSTDAAIVVFGDEKALLNIPKKNFKSILTNLLSNALKYRSPERTPHVIVKLEKAGNKTQLTVTDNGLGIPKNRQNEVFTLFKRFHDHVEGSGLGLYIVKRMIDKCNGQILVNSTENQGTRFTIVF